MGVTETNEEIEQNKERVRALQQEHDAMVPTIIAAVQHVIVWSKDKARATAEEVVAHNPTRQEKLSEKMEDFVLYKKGV